MCLLNISHSRVGGEWVDSSSSLSLIPGTHSVKCNKSPQKLSVKSPECNPCPQHNIALLNLSVLGSVLYVVLYCVCVYVCVFVNRYHHVQSSDNLSICPVLPPYQLACPPRQSFIMLSSWLLTCNVFYILLLLYWSLCVCVCVCVRYLSINSLHVLFFAYCLLQDPFFHPSTTNSCQSKHQAAAALKMRKHEQEELLCIARENSTHKYAHTYTHTHSVYA